MTNRRKLIIAAIVLLIAAFFLFSRLGRSNAAQFQTAMVTCGPITQTVTATGTLNPVVNVQVGSRRSQFPSGGAHAPRVLASAPSPKLFLSIKRQAGTPAL